MKKLFLTVFAFCLLIVVIAQPQAINYQAMAKNNNGNPIANQQIGVQISILNNGNLEYQEIHSTFTNDIGLYTLQIGSGNALNGNFSAIDWSSFNKMVEIEIDPNGGTNYVSVGAFPFLSVPYALYAGNVNNGFGVTTISESPHDIDGTIGPESGVVVAVGMPTISLPDNPEHGQILFISATNPFTEIIFYHDFVYGSFNFPAATYSFSMFGSSNQISLAFNSFSGKWTVAGSSGSVNSIAQSGKVKNDVPDDICYTSTSSACADIRYKKDITQISGALQNIMKITGIKYNWDKEKYKYENFTTDTQIGVIAQELESYFPELVMTNDAGYKSVDYPKLTAVLIEAIKEQETQYKVLEKRLKQIEDFLATTPNQSDKLNRQ